MKRKVRPVLASMNEYPNVAEWYYSPCSGVVSGPANYSDPNSSKCISVQPLYGFPSCCTDENDFRVSSFLQPGKILNSVHPQLRVKKEKLDRISRPSITALQRDHLKKTSTGGDETSRLDFPKAQQLCVKLKNMHKSKTVADDTPALCGVASRKSTCAVDDDDKAPSSPLAGGCNQQANIGNDHLSLKIGGAVKREETSDTCIEDSIDLASGEVVRVIGQRVFLKARKTMIQ